MSWKRAVNKGFAKFKGKNLIKIKKLQCFPGFSTFFREVLQQLFWRANADRGYKNLQHSALETYVKLGGKAFIVEFNLI